MKARCAAAAGFAAALPGGVWLDRGPDAPAGAYAVMTLETDDEPDWFSDGSYLQGYTLRLAAYTVQGLRGDTAAPQQAGDTAAAQAAQLAMAAALNPNPTAWDALRAGRVNLCLPRGYTGKHAPELREGRDVFAAAGQWHLTIEGSLTP